MLSSIFISALVMIFVVSTNIDNLTKIMICWNIFGLSYLIFSWITFYKEDSHSIKKISAQLDKGHNVIFTILLFATLLSLIAILFILKSKEEWKLPIEIVTLIYFSGVIVSWFLHQTIFTTHYAHLYYRSLNKGNPILSFPGTTEPNYMDFAYFSFILGMTFQVADVTINSGQMRKIVLLHSVISFGFNTIIIALSVNAIVSI